MDMKIPFLKNGVPLTVKIEKCKKRGKRYMEKETEKEGRKERRHEGLQIPCSRDSPSTQHSTGTNGSQQADTGATREK